MRTSRLPRVGFLLGIRASSYSGLRACRFQRYTPGVHRAPRVSAGSDSRDACRPTVDKTFDNWIAPTWQALKQRRHLRVFGLRWDPERTGIVSHCRH